jgi:RND family efflux transporter MFP subunit
LQSPDAVTLTFKGVARHTLEEKFEATRNSVTSIPVSHRSVLGYILMNLFPYSRRSQAASFICLAFISALALSGCGNTDAAGTTKAGAPPQMPPAQVGVITAQPAPVNESTEYVATLKSRNSTTVSPQVDGQITRIFVRSGERVNAGTPLMQIDPLKQAATVGSQEATHAAKIANVKYAEQQLARTKQLAQEGVVSRQALDESQAAYDAAKAELGALEAQVREQRVQLKYYSVAAQTSGIVGDIPVHEGDRVTTSTVLTTIDQPGSLELYVSVPVEKSGDLALNKRVEVLDSSGAKVSEGRISFISPKVDDQTQSILVKTTVNNNDGKLRTSQFTRARIIWGSRPGLLIPVLAVTRVNGQFFAYIAEGEQGKPLAAHQRQVRLGDMIGNDYVVLEGIKPGEKVITSGTQMLFEGAPVTPKS